MALLANDDLYERDFHAWTQDQAARLRALGRDNRFDVAHVAEEIEDLGKRERRDLESHLHQLLRHLIKLAWSGADEPRPGWRREVRDHHRAALRTLRDSPGLRQKIDLAAIWAAARADANADLSDYGEAPYPDTLACPFATDDVLGDVLDPGDAVATLVRAGTSQAGDAGT
ncbi:protein of unknown function DUF29 [Limimonas halophila]|uniref:DUF29 domain-containing protein n=1 Tax=Limimonas halophila TaxID=1082479 RepID=A0A1G7PVY7_9PROT|nr:DUF29 domain-containing protein [Limimonas halophila]SDF89540.1 protein of unknown function DUF29 [Limimonas halophila]